MIKDIIKDMAKNGILPIAIFEKTLHVYYKESWYAIEEEQYTEFCSLRYIIDETITKLDSLGQKEGSNA